VWKVAYCLQLLESSRIHSVFDVLQLKLVVGTDQVEKELPHELQGQILV